MYPNSKAFGEFLVRQEKKVQGGPSSPAAVAVVVQLLHRSVAQIIMGSSEASLVDGRCRVCISFLKKSLIRSSSENSELVSSLPCAVDPPSTGGAEKTAATAELVRRSSRSIKQLENQAGTQQLDRLMEKKRQLTSDF